MMNALKERYKFESSYYNKLTKTPINNKQNIKKNLTPSRVQNKNEVSVKSRDKSINKPLEEKG